MTHYLSSLFFIVLFYGICLYAFLQGNTIDFVKKVYKSLSLWHKLGIIITIILSLVLTVYWKKQDQFIYFWDIAAYWDYSINTMKDVFSNSFFDIIRNLIYSINNEEFNIFLPHVISLPLKLFGYSYIKYILINQIMFLIPALIVQVLTILKMQDNTDGKYGNLFVLLFILSVMFPANYYALYYGYIDIAYLLPFSILIYIFLNFDIKKYSFSQSSAIGLLFLLSWISRRYTIFFIIGYVIAFFLKAIVEYIKVKNKQVLINIFFNILTMGIFSLLILLILFPNFISRVFTTNYMEMYSAYNSSLLYKINELSLSYSYLYIFIALFVGLCSISIYNLFVKQIYILVLIISELFIFSLYEVMGPHHRLILSIPISIIVLSVFIIKISGIHPTLKKIINIIQIICVLFYVLNFHYSYIQKPQYVIDAKIFSAKYNPLIRNDIPTIKEIVNYINSKPNKNFYTTASGWGLNFSILCSAKMPIVKIASPNLMSSSDVDLWHGFSNNFLKADYIIATNPTETHLKKGQEVIIYLNESVINSDSYIGQHYKLIKTFDLDNNVKALIYEKISEYTQEDLDQIKQHYTELYPNHNELFADRIHL